MTTRVRWMFAILLVIGTTATLEAKNWTWYIRSTAVVAGAPGRFDVEIGLKANTLSDEGKTGNFNLRGTKSASLYDFGSGNDPLLQAIAVPGVLNTDMTLTNPSGADNWQLNYVYTGAAASGASVTVAGISVCTIRFFIQNPSGSSVFNQGVLQQTYESDNTTQVTVSYDNSGGQVPLPIELASVSAEAGPAGAATIRWSTISETNCYGFEVQRSPGGISGFISLPGSFTAGHGTSTERHDYAYSDASAGSATYYYRLKQIDLGGAVSYSDAVSVAGRQGAGDPAPVAFALMQNYPNPFNPESEIRFAVGETGMATLRVYSVTGQLVATLFDGIALSGQYYRVTFNGARLASGAYLYRLQSAGRSDVRRMLLVR